MTISRFLTTALIGVCSMTAYAQQMITISQNAAMTKNLSTLNGKASVLFVANSDDMVVTSNINKDPQSPKAVKVGNMYYYEMIIDISGGNRRDFTVTKYKTTNSYKISKVQLSPNQQLFFDIEQVEKGIDIKIDPYTEMGWLTGKKGEALIVFNSNLKLNIHCPNLKHRVGSGKSKAGTFLDSLMFDVSQFTDLALNEARLSEEYEEASKKRDREAETMDDATYDALIAKIPQLMEEKNKVSGQLAELLKIEISSDKTNKLTIDYNQIKTMSPKGLMKYNIVVLNETKVVVETQYGEYLRQADTEFQDRQYARAANFYRLAAKEKGISSEQKNVALEKATSAMRYDTIMVNAEKYSKMLNDIIANNREIQKVHLIKAFDQAILAYRSLANSTGDDYFKNQLEKLQTEKKKIGIVLEGITRYSELHQGVAEESVLGGCKFYGVKGAVSDDMRSNIYWSNDNELATSNSDGAFKFQVTADQYDFIVVVGAHNGKIKSNKVIPMKGRGDSKLRLVFGKK